VRPVTIVEFGPMSYLSAAGPVRPPLGALAAEANGRPAAEERLSDAAEDETLRRG
jgi:hypothetical protein